jgi:fatty acid elongase 3
MAPLADLLLAHVPFPPLPHYLTSYVPGETPLSTTPAVVAALVSYLAVIFGVQAVMKDYSAQKLTSLFRAHNMFLSAGSLILMVLMIEEIAPIALENGLYFAMCNAKAWTSVSSPFFCYSGELFG